MSHGPTGSLKPVTDSSSGLKNTVIIENVMQWTNKEKITRYVVQWLKYFEIGVFNFRSPDQSSSRKRAKIIKNVTSLWMLKMSCRGWQIAMNKSIPPGAPNRAVSTQHISSRMTLEIRKPFFFFVYIVVNCGIPSKHVISSGCLFKSISTCKGGCGLSENI